MLIRFGDSLSPFVDGFVSNVLRTFPFVDATELLSPYGVLATPFGGAGLFLPFSIPPLMPFTDNVLPFWDDRWSQVLTLVRPFGMELRPPS